METTDGLEGMLGHKSVHKEPTGSTKNIRPLRRRHDAILVELDIGR